MVDIDQRVAELKNKVQKLADLLNSTAQTIDKLKQEKQLDRNQLQAKEKELEDWRQELELLQQNEIKIKKEIREKVIELEQSQLSNTEKQTKINKLLTENSEELEKLDQLLYDERSQYRSIRNELIGKLCEPCSTCQIKKQAIVDLVRVRNWLFGAVFLLLILLLLSFFRGYCSQKKPNKNKKITLT